MLTEAERAALIAARRDLSPALNNIVDRHGTRFVVLALAHMLAELAHEQPEPTEALHSFIEALAAAFNQLSRTRPPVEKGSVN